MKFTKNKNNDSIEYVSSWNAGSDSNGESSTIQGICASRARGKPYQQCQWEQQIQQHSEHGTPAFNALE